MKLFPDDLLYSREHVWVKVDGNLATLGITDYAQEKLGEAIDIELPEVESYLESDEPFGTLDTASKGTIDLISPLSGEVISVNDDLPEDIGIVNSDPHETGWMIIVDMSFPDELDDLMDLREYNEYLTQELDAD